jgi:hypothetical protein
MRNGFGFNVCSRTDAHYWIWFHKRVFLVSALGAGSRVKDCGVAAQRSGGSRLGADTTALANFAATRIRPKRVKTSGSREWSRVRELYCRV